MDKQASPSDIKQLALILDSATATLASLSKQLSLASSLVQSLATPTPGTPANSIETKRAVSKTPRDTSRWKLNGRFYPKGRFLLEIFRKYVNGKMNLKEVENQFNSDAVFAGQVIPGNRVLYNLADDVKDPKRFHTGQPIVTKDGKKLVVSNQFGTNNFPALLKYLTRQFGIPLKMEGEEPYSEEWRKLLE